MKHEELIALLREASKELKHLAEVADDNHGGRSWEDLVAHGDQSADLPQRIDAALAGPVDLVALSDVADLQRYTLGGHCDSFGQDCEAEMEEDDEGEYLLFIDVLNLGPKP